MDEMKQKDYMKAVLEKVDDQNRITCEDCGKKDMMSHVIVDHAFGTIKIVCHSCFVAKYQDGIYGKGG